MAKKSTSVEEVIVETKPSEGYPSRDFFTPIEGVANARLENSTTEEANGGQEEA